MERKISSYEQALDALEDLAQTQSFQGQGGFYGWERLQGLLQCLKAAFDAYELEGDAAPTRRAVEAYQADLATHQVRQDLHVVGVLERLLADLEERGLELRIEVARQDPGIPSAWPPSTLAVTAE